MTIKRILKIETEGVEAPPAIFINDLVIDEPNDDGEVEIDLEVGENVLTYDVRGAGGKATLKVGGEPEIVVPVGATWPFEVKVPLTQTFALSSIYFIIGG